MRSIRCAMTDIKRSLNPTVADCSSSDDDDKPQSTPPPRRSSVASSKRGHHSKAPQTPQAPPSAPAPPSSSRKTSAPDTASVDSGYSSKTTATQSSADSAKRTSKGPRPIRTDAPAAASPSHAATAPADPRRRATSSASPTKFATAPAQHPLQPLPQQAQFPPHLLPHPPQPLHPTLQQPVFIPVPQQMAPRPHHDWPESRPRERPYFSQRPSPVETPWDTNYPPFQPPNAQYHTSHLNNPQPQPAPSAYPPSGPQPRRIPPGGHTRNRPASYYDNRTPPVGPAPIENYGRDFYDDERSYAPDHTRAPQIHQLPPREFVRRPSTTANASPFRAPPAFPVGQQPPPSPLRQSRPPLQHYETEGHYPSAMVEHAYGDNARYRPSMQLQPPQPLARTRRSTSPSLRYAYDDQAVMGPPPRPPPLARPLPAEPVRRGSIYRQNPPRLIYHDSDEAVDDDYAESDRTIRAPRDMPRPSILPMAHDEYDYSMASVQSRNPLEAVRSRRRSSVAAPRDRTREMHGDLSVAEEYMARTSRKPKEMLTAEAVKKANRNSLDSSSRSHRSRGESERDGTSSHASRGESKINFRQNEDKSWEFQGDGIVKVIPQADGSSQFVIQSATGRETGYRVEGSRTSRTSNKSFASRASARPDDLRREGRQKSDPERSERRRARARRAESNSEDD